MKKIMIIALVAILFVSCGNPVMPVDDTDDRLVGTWTNADTTKGSYTFKTDGTYTWNYDWNSDGIYDETESGTWTTIDNSEISFNDNPYQAYKIVGNIFSFGSNDYTKE